MEATPPPSAHGHAAGSPLLPALGTLAGVVLGGVFLLAAVAKIIDPVRFAELIESKHLTLGMPAMVVAYLAIGLEIALGVALVLGVRRLPVLLTSLALVLFFVVLSTMAWMDAGKSATDDDADCGCFGNLIERTPEEAFYWDLALLPLALLTFVGRSRAGARWPKARTAVVAVATLAGLGLTVAAPEIAAFDDLATRLHTGKALDEICAGQGEDKICLSDIVPDWETITQLVVISEPFDAANDAPMNAYFDWHYELEDPDQAPELLWLYRSLSKEDKAELKFPSDGREPPKVDNLDVPARILRGLYRRLPRGFLVRDGKVVEVWDGLPPFDRWMK